MIYDLTCHNLGSFVIKVSRAVILKSIYLELGECSVRLPAPYFKIQTSYFAEKRKGVFGKRHVMELFRFHPTLILLFLKECQFYSKF